MAKSNPVLSILVPAITERLHLLKPLLGALESQVHEHPVEILVFMDNCKRSIGMKRDALVQMSRGAYVSFVDDDDDVAPDYVMQIVAAAELKPDVITFENQTTINGEQPFIVNMSLQNPENDQARKVEGKFVDIKRRPWHICAWRGEIARSHRFPDINYGEDWKWVAKFVDQVETEVHIDKVLHYYKFDANVTRAT